MEEAVDPRVRLDAMLAEALDLDGEARTRYLKHIEDTEPELAAALCNLVRLADAPGLDPHTLTRPLWQAMFERGFHSNFATNLAADTQAAAGTIIGAWRMLSTLGRGGMGTVYLVERSEGGFRQRGALKLMRSGTDSDEFLRRFAQERQILASLNHPAIARLLDGGRDVENRPYLVMEYVEGGPIDHACDQRRLSIDERVALFVQVAQAVAYAHRNLIAHRDIKPSNIIVDIDGQPKLLDFGIAKALSNAVIACESLTLTALRAFTPDYATPEQVLGQPTSTATDVYQLGLLLYELLSGQRAQCVTSTTQIGLEDAVCRTQPVRPSERIGVVGAEIHDVCVARQTTPTALRRKLSGDLDNIVLKALRKAPERRYTSVIEMIEDLEYWRQGRPVHAQPETFGYRSKKFVVRHAWAVAASSAILTLVISYAVTVTIQANALARERDRAQAEAAKARQVQALVLQLFQGADPEHSGGIQLSARELLDRGWSSIERELGGQLEVRAELLATVGEAYRKLGVFDRAEKLSELEINATRPLAVNQPLLWARALRNRGRLLSEQGNYAAAEPLLRDALRHYKNPHDGSPERAESGEVAITLSDLGMLFNRKADYAAAESLYRESLFIRRQLYGERHPSVAESLDDLGMMLRQRGDYVGARPLLVQALELRRQLLPPNHPQLAQSLSNLALVHKDLGDYDSAEALYREAIKRMQQALGETHPSVGIVMNNLSTLLKIRRDYPAAQELLEKALSIRRKALGEVHPMVALNLNDLGLLLSERADLDGAATYYKQALQAYPVDHPWRSATVFNIGRLAESRGDFVVAERHYREALALQRKEYGEDHDRVGMDWNRLGIVLHRQGRLDEAEASIRRALAIYRKRLPQGHQRFAAVLLPLGSLLVDRGRTTEAKPLLREGWQVRQKAFGDGDPRTIEAAAELARAERSRN